jgi:Flp pilus assembly protein CpaB
MKPKTMMLMVVAIGCGLGASYMTSRLLAERNNQGQTEATVKVLVAKQKVAPWVPVKDPEKLFELKDFPESIAPKKGIRSFEEIKDQRLNKGIEEDKFVTTDDLLSKEQASLAGMMKPGERAIALRVNAETLAGGFIFPSSRVDIVSTTRGGQESVSQIIMQDMLVLAIDTNATRDPQAGSMVGSTVTLAAKPEESLRLSLAASMGELRLILRPLGETGTVKLPPTKAGDLNKPLRDGSSAEGPEPVVAAPPVPATLPPVEAPKTEEVVKAKEPEPEEDKRETHVMKITQGEYTQKAVFYKDPAEGWTAGGLGANNDAPAPKKRRQPAPAAGPDATPAAPAPAGDARPSRAGRSR